MKPLSTKTHIRSCWSGSSMPAAAAPPLRPSAAAAAAGAGATHATRRLVCRSTSSPAAAAPSSTTQKQPVLLEERGAAFTTGPAFYRGESAQARDLAVLAAAAYRKNHGSLRVLDVMAGSGVRAARYISQAGADCVWSNDFNPTNRPALVYNTVSAMRAAGAPPAGAQGALTAAGDPTSDAAAWTDAASRLSAFEGLRSDVLEWRGTRAGDSGSGGGDVTCRVSRVEANRLLVSRYLAEDFYDLVDVDSFGSDTLHLPAAIDTVKYGGMLFLTSTDGISSGGKRPERSLAAYGAYLRSLPFSNEQGLRMLIGAAVKEGAARGAVLRPLFSYYSFHGPVFRVMLEVTRGNTWPSQHYGFVGHCHVHGDTRKVPWRDLGHAVCRCCEPGARGRDGSGGGGLERLQTGDPSAAAAAGGGGGGNDSSSSSSSSGERGGEAAGEVSPPSGSGAAIRHRPTPLSVSGPMWTGPLHDRAFLEAMASEAASRGWRGHAVPLDSPTRSKSSKINGQRRLEELLEVLLEESDPALPPWYMHVDDIAKRLDRAPGRDELIEALRAAGHPAARSHVERKAIKTAAGMAEVVAAAETRGYRPAAVAAAERRRR